MIFPWDVKKNGIYYPAGTDVPTGTGKRAEMPSFDVPGKVEPTDEEIQAKSDAVFSDFDKKAGEKKRKYTEDDLNLPYMKLKSLATKEGFKVDKTAKADDIKEMLRSL